MNQAQLIRHCEKRRVTYLMKLEKLTKGYGLHSQDCEEAPRFLAKFFDIA